MQLGPFLIDHQTPIDAQESSLNTELSHLPTDLLAAIRQELGLVDRELQSLALDEKSLIINIARHRGANIVVGLPGLEPTNNLALEIVNYGVGTRIGALQAPRDTATRIGMENDVYAIIDGLAMVNLSGGRPGTPFNPAPGQDDDRGQAKLTGMMLPSSQTGSPPKEPSQDVNESPTPSNDGWSWPFQPERYLTTGIGIQQPSHVGASPPTPSVTGSSISAGHDDMPTVKRETSLPEVPANFLTREFVESVARTLDDFDTRALLGPPCCGINFEEDFRSWFNPDDISLADDDQGIRLEEEFGAWFNSDDTNISENTDISFEPDFGEWFDRSGSDSEDSDQDMEYESGSEGEMDPDQDV